MTPAARTRRSAGLMVYRVEAGVLRVLLVHPGGPFWARKDDGAWSIPKGEHGDDEDPLAVAYREFAEELGQPPPAGTPEPLGEIVQAGGKRVGVWALEGQVDATTVRSNTFVMEWPPRSGRQREFPEVDRAAWFTLEEARTKLHGGQVPLLERLVTAGG